MRKLSLTLSLLLSVSFVISQPAFAMWKFKQKGQEETERPSQTSIKIIPRKEQTPESKLDTLNSVGATIRSVQSSIQTLAEIATYGGIKKSRTPICNHTHGKENIEITISGISESLSGAEVNKPGLGEDPNTSEEKTKQTLITLSSTVKNLTDLIVKIINDDLSWENLKAPYDPKDKKTSCQELLKDSVTLLQRSENSIRVTFPKEYKENAEEFIKITFALLNRSNPIYSQTAILNDNSPAQSRKEVKQKSSFFEKNDSDLKVIEQLKADQKKAEKLNKRLTMLIQQDEETINSPTPLDLNDNTNSPQKQHSMTDIKRHAINPDDPQTLRELSSLSKTKSSGGEGGMVSFLSKKFETSNKSNPVEGYGQKPSNPELRPQPPQRKRSTTAPSSPRKQVIDELTQRFQGKENQSGSNKTTPNEQKH